MALTAGFPEIRKRAIRVLILTKKGSEYGSEVNFRSGLNNTASFLAEELFENLHIETKFVACRDANQIDREVHHFKPSHVVLEAIWVTPEKLAEIQKLHRHVVFTVRIHSKISFLAYEGNAIEWIKRFQEIPHVFISFNSKETFEDFKVIMNEHVLVWLPNIYKKVDYEKTNVIGSIMNFFKKPLKSGDGYIFNVACFGAIRPMKDILLQAFAAMSYCDTKKLKLRFHINTGRIEQRGDSTLKNLRALFANTKHELVEHDWLGHKEFLELIKTIDLGMQVSLNESFNVVSADYVYNFKPIVVSEQVHWVSNTCKVKNDIAHIIMGIHRVFEDANVLKENLQLLKEHNEKSLIEWKRFLLETQLLPD